jgi:hypothetical protein
MSGISEHLRGPWKAILAQGPDVLEGTDPLGELDPGNEVDISIRRESALPDSDGFLPGTCFSGDVIELWDDLYVEDGDPATSADARWAQAQAMAAGLNAAAEVLPGQPEAGAVASRG